MGFPISASQIQVNSQVMRHLHVLLPDKIIGHIASPAHTRSSKTTDKLH